MNCINKLYLDPIESINTTKLKPKGYKIKGDNSKDSEKIKLLNSLPNLRINTNTSIQPQPQSQPQKHQNQLMGSVIIQNWETAKNVPEDIGDLIHFPVLIDRNKYRYKDIDKENTLNLPQDKKSNFSKMGIKKKGELLLKPNKQLEHITITSPNYFTSQSTTIPQLTSEQTEEDQIKPPSSSYQLNSIRIRNKDNLENNLTIAEPAHNTLNLKTEKKQKIIDFTTFNKHLYLRDNDFLYAKRVGGPVDFVLCTYQDINPKSKINNNMSQNLGGRKMLPSLNKKKKKC